MIFLVLTEKCIKKDIELIKRAGSSIRGVELRADFLAESELGCLHLLIDYCKRKKLKTIFTLRRQSDGGQFSGTLNRLEDFYFHAASFQFDYIDLDEKIENSFLLQEIENANIKLIRSIHDFSGIPSDLVSKMQNFANQGAIPKAAVMVNGTDDFISLFDIASELKDVEKILIGMGAAGFPSRVLTSHFGSILTFCSWGINNSKLGHIDPVTLAEKYRYYQVSRKTQLAGIIGNPIMHSQSPLIHNKGYDKNNIDALYLPFQTDRVDHFGEIVSRLKLKGISVTIPYKESVLSFLSKREASVESVGACNTVFFHHQIEKDNDGKLAASLDIEWEGFNTDVEGFLRPLRKRFDKDLLASRSLKTAVIGAGGAARAIIFALKTVQAEVVIFNRTKEKALTLAREFSCDFFNCEGRALNELENYSKQFDLIVQGSSAGMGDLVRVDPSAGYCFSGCEVAYEIIYTPEQTQFLKRANAAGCRVIKGFEMLQAQAERQFEIFTNGLTL